MRAITIIIVLASAGLLLARVPVIAKEEAMDSNPVHSICWLEFNTKQLDSAQQFFTQVFGWKCEPFMEGYLVFTTPDGQMGGFSSRAPEGTQPTLAFIYVPEILAALAGIEAAGGVKVFGPEKVGETGGQIAFFKDPAGTIYGLADMQMPVEFSPDPFGMTGGDAPRHNSLCAIELYASDFAVTREFFGSQFGWQCTETMPQYMALNPGAGIAGTFQSHTPDGRAMAYIWSDDLDATVQAAKDAGAALIGDVFAAPGMPRFAYFTAPGGIVFGVIGK
jgi:uncharacterized protein